MLGLCVTEEQIFAFLFKVFAARTAQRNSCTRSDVCPRTNGFGNSSPIANSNQSNSNKLSSTAKTVSKVILVLAVGVLICILSAMFGSYYATGATCNRNEELNYETESLHEQFIILKNKAYIPKTRVPISLKNVNRNFCLRLCTMIEDCVTAVYGGEFRVCDLFNDTPYHLNLKPIMRNESYVHVKAHTVFPGQPKGNDRYYFISDEYLKPSAAKKFCQSVNPLYHSALLSFDETTDVMKYAGQFWREINSDFGNKEPSDIVVIALVGNKTLEQTGSYASIARKVSDRLRFRNGQVTNLKMMAVATDGEAVRSVHHYKRYPVLCQADPFNLKNMADFYLNLPRSRVAYPYKANKIRM